MSAHDKAFIINKTWAGIFSAVLVAGIVGATGTAISAYAQMAVMREDVKDIKDAKLEPRVITIEQTVKRMEVQQARMDDKLDVLLEQAGWQRAHSENRGAR